MVVHIIPKTRCVNNGEADYYTPQPVVLLGETRENYSRQRTFEEFLLQLSFSDLNFHCFIDLLRVAAPVIGIVFDRG